MSASQVLIWDKHASSAGIGALCLCLLGGSLYQQAPLKETPANAEEIQLTTAASDEEEARSSRDETPSRGRQ